RFKLQALLGGGAAALAFALLYGNLRLARRFTAHSPSLTLTDATGQRGLDMGSVIRMAGTPFAGFVALLSAIHATGMWATWALAMHAGPFGSRDPVFGRDIGFYVFELPLLEWLIAFVGGIATVTMGVTAVAYLGLGGIVFTPLGPRAL